MESATQVLIVENGNGFHHKQTHCLQNPVHQYVIQWFKVLSCRLSTETCQMCESDLSNATMRF